MGPWEGRCTATSGREGEVGFSGATMVVAVDEGASEAAAVGFEGGRVAVVGAVSRSSYIGFLSCMDYLSAWFDGINWD